MQAVAEAVEKTRKEVAPASGGASLSAREDVATVEHRLNRIRAILVALSCVAHKRVDFGNAADTCEFLKLVTQKSWPR